MKKSLSPKLIIAIAGIVVIAIALFIYFVACGKGRAREEIAPGVFQKSMLGGDYKSASFSVCESENAYHIYVSGNMYYVDKTDMRAVIACGKAECTHWGDDWKTCNSHLTGGSAPYYYSGKLYYGDFATKKGVSLYSLHSCDLDGTNRKLVQALQTHSGAVSHNEIPVAIHNNITMFQSTEGNFPTGANVYAGPLGTDAGDATRLLSYETSDDTAAVLDDEVEVWDMWADGDYFYCVGLTTSDSGTRKQVIYRYNPASGDFSQIWTVPDASEVGEWSETGVRVQGWYIDEGILWYYLDGNGVWRCDLDSGKNELVFPVKEDYASTASFDGEYIYINTGNADLSAELFGTLELYAPFEERKIDVYDKTGGFIASISCAGMYYADTAERKSLGQSSGILGASEEYVFIACYSYGQDLSDVGIYAVEKKSFDEPKLLIEENYTYEAETDTSILIRTYNDMESERLTR